jgi:16S rRNA (cytidine1402-2'-O)-methyltransferase
MKRPPEPPASLSSAPAEADDPSTPDVLPAHLYLVATPIGNLGDLSFRGLSVLRGVDAIACEDTRRTLKLLSHFGVPRPSFYFSCHEHNERAVVGRVLGLLREGHSVALCTDSGMPLVSDPGFIVTRETRAAGFAVEVVPGPSAVQTALVASGLAVHSYTFKGFAPRKSGQRRRFLEVDAISPHTLVLFESPFRLGALLLDAATVLGAGRPAAVCLELTKRFERIEKGTLGDLASRFAVGKVQGEITIVIAGAGREEPEAEDEGL